jgi:histidinol-phosphatase (PHP family)
MFDCHVHSKFSGDSEMEMEDAIHEAKKQGLSGLIFTDHLDYDYPDYDDVFMIDFEQYQKAMGYLKQTHQKPFQVFMGIEVGMQPHVKEQTEAVIKKYPFDYVISSIHVVDKLDLHNGDFCKGKSKFQSYERYFEAVFEMVQYFQDFDVIGHLDLIRRYGQYEDKTLDLKQHIDIIDAILKHVIKGSKGIEINASGFRYQLDSFMPGFEIIKRYKELGGEILCFGSDAHGPQFVGHRFSEMKELAKKAGFSYVAHFEARKPHFTKL